MAGLRFFLGLRTTIWGLVALLAFTSAAAAAEKVLHNFGNGYDGIGPQFGNLIFDTAGNLYGVTPTGGSAGDGAVFQMTPNQDGGWTERVIYNFRYGDDGAEPSGGLVMDGTGNLYGTTMYGSSHNCGTVYELMPNGSGGWTEKQLHLFRRNNADGCRPYAGLIFDTQGNLYGTTYEGGSLSLGAAFELSPNGSGGWTERVVHNFGMGTDGTNPAAPLTLDSAGNLYGTTVNSGYAGCSCGTVFEMTPNGDGSWTEKTLHSFGIGGVGGAFPYSPVIFDTQGNLYGTTSSGGTVTCGDEGCGTAYELTPNGDGGWTYKTIHNFGLYNGDGTNPIGGLILDSRGNLFGTTVNGGNFECQFTTNPGCGTVFQLAPNGSGGWAESKLHNFGIVSSDGNQPFSGLILDSTGNLYGTTEYGGGNDDGTVFEVTP
jgi:uncharacterized repeat protein (TIGR03803 family)